MASIRRLPNGEERSNGTHPFLRLAQGVSIEEVLDNFAKIVAEKGIGLCGVRFVRAKFDREFKIPGAGAGAGEVCELDIGVEGGQTHLIVRFREPGNGAAVSELESAAHLAAHRIELLAGRELRVEGVGKGREVPSVIQGLIGNSEPMKGVVEGIAVASACDSTVLITGESGTGKELVARAIHNRSKRVKGPFVPVNCSAFAESLLESELFGYVKGAFTGATETRKGLFEAANGGTLFLDEIGAATLATQQRLLRVLQEHKNRPLGAHQEREIDVRVIAATNRDLPREIREGRFCLDLFYRLNVLSIQMPSLRERLADLPLLIEHFLGVMKERHSYACRPEIEPEAIDLLYRYCWPGNVRELEAVVERLSAMAGDGGLITDAQARRQVAEFERLAAMLSGSEPASTTQIRCEISIQPANAIGGIKLSIALHDGESADGFVKRLKLALCEKMLELTGGNYSKAAYLLGLSRTAFHHQMKRMCKRINNR